MKIVWSLNSSKQLKKPAMNTLKKRLRCLHLPLLWCSLIFRELPVVVGTPHQRLKLSDGKINEPSEPPPISKLI
jgi:hypothetical protein